MLVRVLVVAHVGHIRVMIIDIRAIRGAIITRIVVHLFFIAPLVVRRVVDGLGHVVLALVRSGANRSALEIVLLSLEKGICSLLIRLLDWFVDDSLCGFLLELRLTLLEELQLCVCLLTGSDLN